MSKSDKSSSNQQTNHWKTIQTQVQTLTKKVQQVRIKKNGRPR